MAMSWLSIVGLGFLAVTSMMFLVWILHLILKNAGVVDIFWGIGFVVLTAIYGCLLDGFYLRSLIIFLMVLIWGLRLSLLILSRVMKEKGEDRRYQKMRGDWKDHLAFKFFLFFESQALFQVILSVPFLIVSLNTKQSISIFEWLGVAVWMVGVAGESLADEQLRVFKSDIGNKGKVCQTGLWNYSRHPNYFFEWVIWMGFFIFALGSPHGWMGILSPLIMLHLLLNVSGVPLAEEQSLRSRGDLYRMYQKTTSIFVPLRKRK